MIRIKELWPPRRWVAGRTSGFAPARPSAPELTSSLAFDWCQFRGSSEPHDLGDEHPQADITLPHRSIDAGELGPIGRRDVPGTENHHRDIVGVGVGVGVQPRQEREAIREPAWMLLCPTPFGR